MGRIGTKIRMKRFRKWFLSLNFSNRKEVFDNIDRNDSSPKNNLESEFNFLNRSSWPKSERVRKLIQALVDNYPNGDADEIVDRLRSGDDRAFLSAFFELFLHQTMINFGCELIPHPSLPNDKTSRPDFLVRTPDGDEFYLEAVLASQRNQLSKSGEALKKNIIDELNKNPHKSFAVALSDTGNPENLPSSKKIICQIHDWLDSLDPEDVIAQMEADGMGQLPKKHLITMDGALGFMPFR